MDVQLSHGLRRTALPIMLMITAMTAAGCQKTEIDDYQQLQVPQEYTIDPETGGLQEELDSIANYNQGLMNLDSTLLNNMTNYVPTPGAMSLDSTLLNNIIGWVQHMDSTMNINPLGGLGGGGNP